MVLLGESHRSTQNLTLVDDIERLAGSLSSSLGRPVKLMALSGDETLAIERFKLNAIAAGLEFLQGYGNASWSLPIDAIDRAITLALIPNVIFTTYESAMTVAGTHQNLAEISATSDIRVVGSPLEAVTIACQNPEKQVVFFAVGYEDAAASTALAVYRAATQNLTNFSVYCNHALLIPAFKAILDSPSIQIDGFICSSHIPSIMGLEPYRFLAQSYKKPVVIADSTSEVILEATLKLLQQLQDGSAQLDSSSSVSIPSGGSAADLLAIKTVFQLRQFYEWRGMGSINFSALKLAPDYVRFDAEAKFNIPKLRLADVQPTQCIAVATGIFQPCQCKVFGSGCTPKNPLGVYMTSYRGICATHYQATL